MNKNIFAYLGLFVVLVILQVTALNNICILGYATPFLYVYFILKLPLQMSSNMTMTLGFLLGLTIDMFSDTPGLNALAALVVAAARSPLIDVIMHRDEMADITPSIATFGMGVFFRYALILILIHNIMIYSIEAFTFFYPVTLILKIVCSTLLTFILVFGIESFNIKRK